MLIGDVGETAREEVDVQLASNPGGGENYGWRYREGFIQNKHYPEDQFPPPPNAVDPIFDYTHGETGSCVVGGYIYRGSVVSELEGLYVFGDCFGPGSDSTGHVFTLELREWSGLEFPGDHGPALSDKGGRLHLWARSPPWERTLPASST